MYIICLRLPCIVYEYIYIGIHCAGLKDETGINGFNENEESMASEKKTMEQSQRECRDRERKRKSFVSWREDREREREIGIPKKYIFYSQFKKENVDMESTQEFIIQTCSKLSN